MGNKLAASGETKNPVRITEAYRDWTPPIPAQKIVTRLVKSVPHKYVVDLGSLALTNASGLSRIKKRQKTRSRKRKVGIADAFGLYHRARKGQPAWIELYVDNIVKRIRPHFLIYIPLCRDFTFAEVVFHEIGHHIHTTCAPEFREREDVAERWKTKLLTAYLLHQYWYLMAAVRLISGGLKKLIRWKRKSPGKKLTRRDKTAA